MPKINAVIKSTPVRYNGEDYEPGEKVVIDESHFIDSLFEKGDEVEEDNDKTFTIDQLKPLSLEDLKDVKNDQIKDALTEAGIEFKANATKADLIKLIPAE